jgi:hypothetical protein
VNKEKTKWKTGGLYVKTPVDGQPGLMEECGNSLFCPQLKIKNMKEETKWEDWGEIYPNEDKKHAVVCYRVDGIGCFQEIMELEDFPVDTQRLSLKLTSTYEAPAKDGDNSGSDGRSDQRDLIRVSLIENCSSKYRSFCDTDEFVLKHEYELKSNLFFTAGRSNPASSASLRCYPELLISAVVSRRLGYWWSNVILPIFIISSTTCAAFAVPAEEVADRCSITLTILLTTVAYKYVVVEKLPEISYLTFLDKYIMTVLSGQILLTLMFTIVGANTMDAEEAPEWEFSNYAMESTIFFLIGLTVLHIALYFWLQYKRVQNLDNVLQGGDISFYVRCFKKEYCVGGGKAAEGPSALVDDFCKAVEFLNKVNKTKVEVDADKLKKTWSLTMRHWTWENAEKAHKAAKADGDDKISSESEADFSVLVMATEGSDADFFLFVERLTAFENYHVKKGDEKKPTLEVFVEKSPFVVDRLREEWKFLKMGRTEERKRSSFYKGYSIVPALAQGSE